eukprot:CAMPEP_0169109184 /NCGR_PEP_ID=MMETSP1015-20121227/25829_1 /TAXON_ID=342587 /ORGANISM="Karlodinium micrum, Strain CCMP2283" /LENGTH=331 /DNA_ID=CAMNT_0009170863 /DNA_START=43 /DNA_END=1038 /DNA_ORIENTATION=+
MTARKRPAAVVEKALDEDASVASQKKPRVSNEASQTRLLEVLASIREGLSKEKKYTAQLEALTKTAETLMNSWDLWIAGHRYRIAELESYVHSSSHVDPYTHGDEGQGSCGVWYFHRKGGSYKSGSFKGLDLACGNKDAGVHAGLLLRAVIDCSSDEIVEGPCLVVDRILKLSGHASIASFAAGRSAAELSAVTTENLELREADCPRADSVCTASRVGLVLREDEQATATVRTHSSGRPSEYCTRPYRFSVAPSRLSKFRSGFAAYAHLRGDAELVTKLQIPKQHCEKYLAAVDAGKKSKDVAKWVNRNVSTQPELCEMIGALHGVLQSLP